MSIPDPFNPRPGNLSSERCRDEIEPGQQHSDTAFICVALTFVLIIGLVAIFGGS